MQGHIPKCDCAGAVETIIAIVFCPKISRIRQRCTNAPCGFIGSLPHKCEAFSFCICTFFVKREFPFPKYDGITVCSGIYRRLQCRVSGFPNPCNGRRSRGRGRGRGGAVLRGRVCTVLRGRVCTVLRGRVCTVLRGCVCTVLRGRVCTVLRGRACTVLRGYGGTILSKCDGGQQSRKHSTAQQDAEQYRKLTSCSHKNTSKLFNRWLSETSPKRKKLREAQYTNATKLVAKSTRVFL